jgi:predicted Zn-dependent protease
VLPSLADWRSPALRLIAGCERGILVTHFFYIRSLDPRTVLNIGLTRDGTFLIEKGKITRSLKNFRE